MTPRWLLLVHQIPRKPDYLRVKVMELLFVKGWANRDVAAFLGVSEQQIANYRFAAVKKLSEHIRNAGLSVEVAPEKELFANFCVEVTRLHGKEICARSEFAAQTG